MISEFSALMFVSAGTVTKRVLKPREYLALRHQYITSPRFIGRGLLADFPLLLGSNVYKSGIDQIRQKLLTQLFDLLQILYVST